MHVGGVRAIVLMAIVLVAALAAATPVLARTHRAARPSPAVSAKKSELARLRAQITSYENQLAKLERTEHSSLSKLDAYTRQTHLLRTLIANLNGEEQRLTRDIEATSAEIASSERQLREMKAQYARAVTALYRRGTQSDLEMLLTAHSMTEAIERGEYLRRFSEMRGRLAENIQSTVTALRDQQSALTEQRDEKAAAAAEKAQQQNYLASQATRRAQLIDKIRSDKSSLRQTLTRAKQSSRAIESLIEKLVVREQSRRKQALAMRSAPATSTHRAPDNDFEDIAHSSRSAESAPPVTAADGSGFGALRGSLRWPCSSRRIAGHFGEHTNPALGTVTMNLGVDIHAPKNSDVVAVAEGTVSLVYWLPSYGTIVILDHRGGYRTVYANLADVSVKQGEHVRPQQLIGHSDATVEAGEVVHFEIWKEREKVDPEGWLARH